MSFHDAERTAEKRLERTASVIPDEEANR